MSDSGSMNLDLGVNLGITLDGAGLQELSNTIKEISKGKDLQRYWKDVESATDNAAKAIERYNRNVNSKVLAENLLKQINALKALTKKENLSELFPNMDLNLDELVESAKKIVPQISSQFSVDSFSQAFKTFDLLKEKSIDLTEAFRKLADYANLLDQNYELKKENSQFRDLIGDSDVEEVKSKLLEIKKLREEASETFKTFLKSSNIVTKIEDDYGGFDYDFDDYRFERYFEAIREGSMTAQQAIADFKLQYDYLLRDNEDNNSDFGLEQLQAFSNKLDSIFRQVEETSTKINDIISNGVITKSIENLSMDSSLSDSQRSIFGNILQDEESLKSITALFQKLIEESNKTSKVDLFNDEQLQQVLSIFDKIEDHLSSLRSIISDVGDGEEFSPLMKVLNSLNTTLLDLKTTIGSLDDGKIRSVAQNLQLINKKVGKSQFNVSIKEDNSLDTMQQQEKANQFLEKQYNTWIKRYESVLSIFNKDNIDPFVGLISDSEIGQMYNYDADALRKLYGKESISGLDNFREKIERITEALRLFRTMATNNLGADDPLFNELNKLFSKSIPKNISTEYLNEKLREIYDIKRTSNSSEEKAKNLLEQINSHNDKINKIDENNKVNDLQAVLDVLNNINKALTELVISATTFSDKFKEGFNITTSVEEIDKLTNRVKELEDELAKIKLNPVSVDKSNISSENSIVESQNKIQEELKETENTIIKVYRAYNKMSGMVGEAGISWFSDDLDTMKTYMNHYKDRELISGDIDINKLLSIDAQGSKHNAITYLGDYSDEASIKITDLYNKIQQLKSELSKTPNDALAQQLKELELEYDKLSEDTSNLYGTHTTNWFAIQAKEAGYLGIAIKNVVDDYDGLIDKPTTTIALFDTNLLENQEKITSKIRENVENIKGLNFDVSKAVETDANSFVNNISPEDLNDEIREIQEFNSLMKLTQMTSEELGSSLREVFSYAHENPEVLDNLYDYNPNLVDVFDKNTNIGKYFDELVSSTNWDVDESSLESIYLDFAKKLQNYENKYIESVKQKLNIISNNIQSDNTYTEETISSNNSIQNELKETQEQAEQTAKAVQNVSETPIKDVFPGGTTSAEKLEEEIKNIDSATEKASESAKEYRKILSQVGEFDIDSKVSAMYKRNDGQLESWTWRAKKDDEGNILYDQDGKIDYDEPTITVISKYEQLEKIIVKADNELRNLQKDLAETKAYDATASTTNIEAKISDQKEYIRLLEQTVKVISQSDEYLLDEQQIIDARNKAAREYALTIGSKQEKADAKQSASDEKKRLANIEQVNRALNRQQITIDAIEKTYNKTTNPDLDREVSNQQDLAELAQKKLAIQTKINSLQGQERNSANEKEFLDLEKLIAEYKELAKYKLKANNPSKQELGGQNLQTLIQVQIKNYDRLITKAEKYGDATSDVVEKLKEQRDILSKIDSDGKYSATADQYYASRDTYKVESATLNAFEAETRAIEQKTQAVKKLSDELEVYNKQIPNKPANGQRSDYFEGFIQNYKNAIDEAQKYLDNLGDSPVTEEVKKEWEKLIEVIEQAKKEMDAVPNADRGSDALSRGKEIDTITKYLNKFTGISKQTKQELKGLLDQLQSGDPSVNVKKIHERFLELTVAERNAGREAKSFFDIFKNKIVYNYAAQLAGYYLSFMDIIRYTRNTVSAIQELDTALVDLKKTTTMTDSELEQFYFDSNDVAKKMGVTTQSIIEQASAWSRLGYSTKEASTQMAELSSQFASISPGMSTDDAQEGLVSIMKAWDISTDQVEREVMDNINILGKIIAQTYSNVWCYFMIA